MGMDWGFSERSLLSSPNNIYPQTPPYPPTNNDALNLGNKVSPSVLLIIIILAIIFFISGLLHLLGRFLLNRHRLRFTRDPDQDELSVTALQGQLQQLFELHDSGVDQSFIDTSLPVFTYKSIIGVKMKTHPFDCAVCLCEFEGEDKLRLLPQCSHAFHMDCIDTWLLSHSTCPLCRASLLLLDQYCSSSPILLLLESAGNTSTNSEGSRPDTHLDDVNSAQQRANSNTLLGSDPAVFSDKSSGEIHGREEEQQLQEEQEEEDKHKDKEKLVVNVTIKLGKFKNVDGGGEGSTSGGGGDSHGIDARRCFSMGSFEYVVDENSSLQVPIIKKATIFPVKKNKKSTNKNNTIGPCHRAAMSECGGGGGDSTRDFNFNSLLLTSIQEVHNPIGRSKRESFSVSKIWLRGKKEKPNSSSNSSSSFRFQPTKNDDGRDRGRTISEIMGIGRSGELGFDQGNQSWRSTDSQAKSPSFTRTLFWLMGWQNNNNNKVVHDSSAIASNV